MSSPSKRMPTGVGALEGDGEASDGGLAAARLPHQAEGLALADGEGDVGDGLDAADLSLEQRPGGDGELLHEVLDLEEDGLVLEPLGPGP